MNIEFRFWDTKDKVYIDWLTAAQSAFNRDGRYLLYDLMTNPRYIKEQYIGLEDDGRKKIYKGDIIRILYTDWPSQTDYSIPIEEYKRSISSIGEVVCSPPSYRIQISNPKYGGFILKGFDYGPNGEMEIVGNINQNPELVNQYLKDNTKNEKGKENC